MGENASLRTKSRTERSRSPNHSTPSNRSQERPASQAMRSSVTDAAGPLPAAVRPRLEAAFGVDLGRVRIHHDVAAREAAQGLSARAFAVGPQVFVADSTCALDLGLMAHEVAHVVQQGGLPAGRPAGGATATAAHLEEEARSAAVAVEQGKRAYVAGRTPHELSQAEEPESPGRLESLTFSAVKRFAPALEPVLRKGIVGSLSERVTTAVKIQTDRVLQPIQEVAKAPAALRSSFKQANGWVLEAVEGLRKGDCSVLTNAVGKVSDVLSAFSSAALDRLKALASKAGVIFTDLWKRFGAPAWEFIKAAGGEAWTWIEHIVGVIWDSYAPLRRAGAWVWKWVMDKLGFGDGPEGQDGVWQWVKRKADEAWAWVREKVERFKKPLMVVGAVLLLLSPAGPLIAIAAVGAGVIKGVQWIRANLRKPGDVITVRLVLERTIIPGITGAVRQIAAALQKGAALVSGSLGKVVAGLGEAAGAFAGGVLNFVASAVKWIGDRFAELAAWAVDILTPLVDKVVEAMEKLRRWLQPLFDVLHLIGDAIGDVFRVVTMVAGKAWHMIPACIRDPVVDFFVNQILKRIPIFKQLIEVPNIWTKLKTVAMTAIRQVFKEGSLLEAATTVFRFMLETLKFPTQLLVAIFDKAAAALDLILADPVGFLKNIVKSLWLGLKKFFGSIGSHLLKGIGGWLFHQVEGAGFEPPKDLSFGSIFTFVCRIIGITIDRVIDIVAKKTSAGVGKVLRTAVRLLTGAWDWLGKLITVGPVGIIDVIKDRISDLWAGVRDAALDWIVGEVVAQAAKKLLSMLDPTGVMAVVNSVIAVYNAIESAIEYLQEMLEIIDRFLDNVMAVAQGSLDAAADKFVGLLDKAMPVVIGFLANQVGLGRIGKTVITIVTKVQEKVTTALEGLVDRALASGRSFLERLGLSGAAKPTEAKPNEAKVAPPGGIHESFMVEDESHELFTDGGIEDLTVASPEEYKIRKNKDPVVLKAYAAYRKNPDSPHLAALLKAVRAWMVHNADSPGIGAPNLGKIGPHSGQPPRLWPRKPGMKGLRIPLWRMESEHISPRAWISGLLQIIGLKPMTYPEYKAMHTILIYERAAEVKTTGKGRFPGDNTSARAEFLDEKRTKLVDKKIKRGDRPTAKEGWKILQRHFSALSQQAIEKTVHAVKQEASVVEPGYGPNASRRGERAPAPTSTLIRNAAKKQLADIKAIVESQLAAGA